MERNLSKASDAGCPPVPQGRPVAEQAANRMRDEPVDEPLPILRIERITIVGRARGAISCPKCLALGINDISLGSSQLDRHIRTRHPTVRTTWECEKCAKGLPSVHSWSCHFAVCNGPAPPEPEGPVRCNLCDRTFGSQRGLSTHERLVHPGARNAKRAELAERPRNPGGRPATIWSDEELEELARRQVEFANERYINVALAPFFPGKTYKQISDARRRLVHRAAPQGDIEPLAPALPTPDREEANEAPPEELGLEEAGNAAHLHIERYSESNEGNALDVAEPQHQLAEPPAPLERQTEAAWKGRLLESVKAYTECPKRWESWKARLQELVNNGNPTGNDIDTLYDEFLRTLRGTNSNDNHKPNQPRMNNQSSNRNQGKRVQGRGRHRPANRAARRAHAFARCQDLMNNAPKKLADIVAANDLTLLQARKSPPRADTQRLYEHLWGSAGPDIPPFERTRDEIPVEEVLSPASATEVERRVGRIASTSAAGPDGVTRGDLTKPGAYAALAALSNLLLWAQHYPTAWRANRTTLIPKVGTDLTDVKNWRPITVSSMISRIYSGLIERRLRSVIKQSERQKGFTEENGCYSNIHLLNAAMANSKKYGGVVTVLDVSKAFDTVPHSIINQCLLRKGIPTMVADYVAEMYRNCRTKIKTADEEVNIELKRGVKQGDPLSPLIFNLAIEPILERLQVSTRGIELAEQNLSVLAFADDLVLLARSAEDAATQIRLVNDSLRNLEMSLSIQKCLTFQYMPSGKTWYVKDPMISIGENRVPYAEPEVAFKYLGVKISPWRGLLRGFEQDLFREIVERAKALPLKPMQKLELLTKYLFPRFTYGLISSPPSQSTLAGIDQIIRTEAKRILHLSTSTSSEFLYSPKRVGGLGLLQLEKMVPIAALRNGIKALESNDPIIRATFERPEANRLREYAKGLAIPWPLTLAELDEFKTRLRHQYHTKWAEQVWQGQGARDFKEHPIGNQWLMRGDLLKSSRVIDAMKLRTNLVPTRAAMKRIEPTLDAACRRCRNGEETLGHILGLCQHTKAQRIRRHDEIKELLRDRLGRNEDGILCEQEILVGRERLKPDLVVRTHDGTVLVLDVTVRYENKDFLAQAAEEKIRKYQPAVGPLIEQLKAQHGRVVPIVVGSRGAMPRRTIQALRELGISKSDWLTISLIALRSSIEMISAFMDA